MEFGLEYPDKALSGREGLAVLLEEERAAKNDPMPTARFYLKSKPGLSWL